MTQQFHSWICTQNNWKKLLTKTCRQILTASFFLKAKKWKQPKCISKWMDQQSVVYPYIEVLLSHKKGLKHKNTLQCRQTSKTLCWVKEVRHKMPLIVGFHLCKMSRKSITIETEGWLVVARTEARETWGTQFNRY